MESGDSSLFRVDVKTGEIFAQQRLAQGIYELVIQAKDGSGLPSEQSVCFHLMA
uniref:CA domain-containing protein n=1 Tax=Heterorhabditis bacteriophora TaxID=37862 RepID=A0A1I7WF93_HETBA